MAKLLIILYFSVGNLHLAPMTQVTKSYILSCLIKLESIIADLSGSNCSASAFKVPEINSAVRRCFKKLINQTINGEKNQQLKVI